MKKEDKRIVEGLIKELQDSYSEPGWVGNGRILGVGLHIQDFSDWGDWAIDTMLIKNALCISLHFEMNEDTTREQCLAGLKLFHSLQKSGRQNWSNNNNWDLKLYVIQHDYVTKNDKNNINQNELAKWIIEQKEGIINQAKKDIQNINIDDTSDKVKEDVAKWYLVNSGQDIKDVNLLERYDTIMQQDETNITAKQLRGKQEDRKSSKNMNTHNDLWWFSSNYIKDQVKKDANNIINIHSVKYNEETLSFIDDKLEKKLYGMAEFLAILAQKYALRHGIADENFRKAFNWKSGEHISVTDDKGQSGTVYVPKSINVSQFINTTYKLFKGKSDKEKSENLEIVFKYKGEDIEKSKEYMYKLVGKENIHPYTDSTRQDTASKGTIIHRNCIWAGAPGTGKSFTLNEAANNQFGNKNIMRVTFHPEYTYYDFVGTYRPKMSKIEKGKIEYDFVPGPFAKMLKKALWNPGQEYCLIIEEINRANMAAVFGDVFQLLDRASENSKADSVKEHESEYAICPTEELCEYLLEEAEGNAQMKGTKPAEDIEKKLRLPANLYLWATMNSADQGVFPMDTAFKRRWSFKNMDIDPDKVTKDDWDKIRRGINELLLTNHVQEDKLMGYYFLKEEERKEDNLASALKQKVMLYLFEDAAKPFRKKVFKESMNTCAKLRSGLNKDAPDLGVFQSKVWDGK